MHTRHTHSRNSSGHRVRTDQDIVIEMSHHPDTTKGGKWNPRAGCRSTGEKNQLTVGVTLFAFNGDAFVVDLKDRARTRDVADTPRCCGKSSHLQSSLTPRVSPP